MKAACGPPMTSSHKTRVHITVDVEGAEERTTGGIFQPARGYDLRVWGRLRNQTAALGIPLLARPLGGVGLPATFFVEPCGSSTFGEEGLVEVCAFLSGRGHDVQVHAHPVQRRIHWHTEGHPRLPDDMAAYTTGEQIALLREAIAILERCGVPRGRLVGFRAGNFGASNDTW